MAAPSKDSLYFSYLFLQLRRARFSRIQRLSDTVCKMGRLLLLLFFFLFFLLFFILTTNSLRERDTRSRLFFFSSIVKEALIFRGWIHHPPKKKLEAWSSTFLQEFLTLTHITDATKFPRNFEIICIADCDSVSLACIEAPRISSRMRVRFSGIPLILYALGTFRASGNPNGKPSVFSDTNRITSVITVNPFTSPSISVISFLSDLLFNFLYVFWTSPFVTCFFLTL